jgi:hypothetical protein
MRQRAIEAHCIANDLVRDLVAASRIHEIYETETARATMPEVNVGVHRVGLLYLMLTLSKCAELYERYKAIVPADVRVEFKALRNEIHSRGIVSFRNTYAGHVWDKTRSRPLTAVEVDSALRAIFRGSVHDFRRWVNDFDIAPDECVVAVISRVREALARDHALTDADLLLS